MFSNHYASVISFKGEGDVTDTFVEGSSNHVLKVGESAIMNMSNDNKLLDFQDKGRGKRKKFPSSRLTNLV
jgi:hypothetical protein